MNHVYSVNGYPHEVWRGDGLAGAGAGVVRVELDHLSLLLCVTHLHAQYPGDDVR